MPRSSADRSIDRLRARSRRSIDRLILMPAAGSACHQISAPPLRIPPYTQPNPNSHTHAHTRTVPTANSSMASLEALAEALSAAEGGAVSTAVLYPLEVRGSGSESMQ